MCCQPSTTLEACWEQRQQKGKGHFGIWKQPSSLGGSWLALNKDNFVHALWCWLGLDLLLSLMGRTRFQVVR